MYRRIVLGSIVLFVLSTIITAPAEARRRCRLFHRVTCRDAKPLDYSTPQGSTPELGDERDDIFATCSSVQCTGSVLTFTCVGVGDSETEARHRLCEFASRCCGGGAPGGGGFVMGPITYSDSGGASGCSCSGGTAAPINSWFATRFYTAGTLDIRLAVGHHPTSKEMAIAKATMAAQNHHGAASVIFQSGDPQTWRKPW